MATRRQLEIFCQAAADCSFRETADRLGLSQPAVSSHIQALERTLGRTLFIRRQGTTPLLSDDGRRLLDTARRTLDLNRQLLAGFAADTRRRVVIAVRHFLLETRIRPEIPRFIDAHPEIDLDLRVVDDRSEMERLVRDGSIDAALYRGDPPADPDLVFRVSAPATLSIYAASQLARRLEIDGTPLSKAPFIMLRDALPNNWIVRRLSEAGLRPENVVLHSQFPDVILQWVLDGRGLAVLFDFAVRASIRPDLFKKVGPPLRPAQSVILTRSEPTTPVTSVVKFLETLLETG